MVKEGMASGIVIIWINYSGALINETEVLSDLDQIQVFFLVRNSFKKHNHNSQKPVFNYVSSAPFDYNITFLFNKCNSIIYCFLINVFLLVEISSFFF